MNKKILIGAGIITLLILIGGFWWLTRGNEEGGGGIGNLFPFGQGDTVPNIFPENNTLPSIQTGNEQNSVTEWEEMRLLSRNAVSGATFVESGTTTVARFVERATGHIFDANLASGNIERISNTTIPKLERVFWRSGGSGFLGQFLDSDSSTVQTKAIEITATTTESGYRRVDEFFLPENILEADVSPQGNRLFYLVRGRSGVEGFRTGVRGQDPALIWQSPTSEWFPEWKTTTLISLTSKAANAVPGFLYLLNTDTGSAPLALSGIEGLTTNASPSGQKILYSTSNGRQFTMRLFDREQDTDTQLSLSTLPEKCAWRSETVLYCAIPQTLLGTLPDEWYQGIVSFTDTLWKIDLANNGGEEQISLLSAEEGGFDVVNPELSPNGQFLMFMNKKDLSLWAVTLERP